MTNLTHTQRRQLEKLASHVDRVIATDLAFFKQHPDRLHRVRPSSEVEIAHLETAAGQLLPQPPLGWRWFTLAKKVPGARLRIFVTNHIDAETGLDVPEGLAAAVFDTAAPPAVREAEAALRARGGGV